MRTLFLCMTLAASTLLADPVIKLEPGNIPARSGAPGTTVGWGFRVTADPTEWIAFIGSGVITESNSLGFYADFIGSQGGPIFGVITPGDPAPWVQQFDLSTFSGLGFYAIDPTATVGATTSGTIRVNYERFSDHPLFCGGDCWIDSAYIDLPFSVDVTAPPSAVPEPSTWMLMSIGGLVAFWRRKTAS
jgi:hypothetical protein